MIVAIDGPAGSGKGTVAKMIDEKLGFTRIDTGAMYRCIALKMLRQNIKVNELDKISNLLENTDIELKKEDDMVKVILDGEDVTKEIRTPEVNDFVSTASSIKIIRSKMVDMQRTMKNKAHNIVMEGRDITTVVFPDADIKIYLDASLEERARRRYKELIENGIDTTFEETLESIRKRDENDMNKPVGALKRTLDQIYIDSTKMTIEEVVDAIVNKVQNC